MLVLTRKLMERLYIGDDICVTVVRLEGGQVRLGIDAPRHISIVRAELDPKRAEGFEPRAARTTIAPAPHAPAPLAPAPLAARPELRPARPELPGSGIRRRGPSR
ncbi:MAG TPA: carbon storage regulator [Isosphaeraceae bacterium]|jgi:carbon storage regulator|nr:carbon storage regulator [Isosphaeraceae bacterium]